MGTALAKCPGRAGHFHPGRQLGTGAVLGRRVWDDAKSTSIIVGPLAYSTFEEFLPGGGRYRALADLSRFYLRGEYEAEAHLLLESRDVPSCRIGQSRLGFTSWVLRSAFRGQSPSVRIPLRD